MIGKLVLVLVQLIVSIFYLIYASKAEYEKNGICYSCTIQSCTSCYYTTGEFCKVPFSDSFIYFRHVLQLNSWVLISSLVPRDVVRQIFWIQQELNVLLIVLVKGKSWNQMELNVPVVVHPQNILISQTSLINNAKPA